MQLCFDATRFDTGLEGAVKLAADKGLSAVEYSFAPFTPLPKVKGKLTAKEKKFLKTVAHLGETLGVKIACLNLDYCLLPDNKNDKSGAAFRSAALMIGKLAQVAFEVNCPKVSIFLAPGAEPGWLSAAEQQLQLINEELAESGVSLLIRLATAPQFRGRSLKSWTAMEPQDWRDLLSVGEGVGLSFSPADCVWLGIDYLKVLPGIVSAIEHIEAHDIEISRDLLKDSGIYGPLWWRYRLPGKGQVDWTQLIEALKLYDFKGALSIHLDDEFVVNEFDMLEDALDSSIKLFAPLVKDN